MDCVVFRSFGTYRITDCSVANSFVLVPMSEYEANPFNLSLDNAVVLGNAIALLFATAFVARILRQFLDSNGR